MVNVIAEIGINHNGDLDTCLEMIQSAKDCGVDFDPLQRPRGSVGTLQVDV